MTRLKRNLAAWMIRTGLRLLGCDPKKTFGFSNATWTNPSDQFRKAYAALDLTGRGTILLGFEEELT